MAAAGQKLNARQQRFVEEYVVDLNGKQAAIRAGYAPKAAEVTASRLLSNAKVAYALAEQQAKVSERTGITVERVIDELAKIGFIDPSKLFTPEGRLREVTELPDDVMAAVASIEVVRRPGRSKDEDDEWLHKIRLWDKRAALVDLGKHLGAFVERKVVDVQGEITHSHEHLAVEDTTRWAADTLTAGAGGTSAESRPH